MSDSSWPHGLLPIRLLCPRDFPGKATGVGSYFLLKGIFPTQGSNSGLLHCRQILYWLSYQEAQGNGNPLQYFGQENPMDRGAWRAAVHVVEKSETRLKRLTRHALTTDYKVAAWSSPCQIAKLPPAFLPFDFAAASQPYQLLEDNQTFPTLGISTVISSTKNLFPPPPPPND